MPDGRFPDDICPRETRLPESSFLERVPFLNRAYRTVGFKNKKRNINKIFNILDI